MNRRTAITNLAALTLAGCTGEAVLAQGSVASVLTEAEIWANPTAHGVLPLEYIRSELLRMTADAVLQRAQQEPAGIRLAWLSGEINGYALSLRLMGVADDLTEEWARGIVATLGRPMSWFTGTHWTMYPGNDAWRRPATQSAAS